MSFPVTPLCRVLWDEPRLQRQVLRVTFAWVDGFSAAPNTKPAGELLKAPDKKADEFQPAAINDRQPIPLVAHTGVRKGFPDL